MIKVLVLFLGLNLSLSISSQHLIGKLKDDIKKEMKTLYPDFALDNTSVNHTYNYLKYIDKITEQTIYIFLSDKDICTSTKLVSDFSNLLQVKKELDKKYKKAGKDLWIYTENGVQYLVKLKREEWFFSVFTSEKNK